MHLMDVPIDSNLSIIGMNGTLFELTPDDREQIIENLALQTLQLILHANRDTHVMIREGIYARNSLFPLGVNSAFVDERPNADLFDKLLHV